MSRKAQAAMEFMLTYGWAIVVVITAIGALAYFGVLNPLDFTPKKCTFPAGLHCQDFEIDTAGGKAAFSIRNNLGGKIEDVKVSVPGCDSWNSDEVVEDGAVFSPELDCSISEGKFNFEPVVSYTKVETGLRFTESGTITGKIGSGGKEAKPTDADECDESTTCDEENECKILDGCFDEYCVYSDADYGTLCNDKNGLCLDGECVTGLVAWWKFDEGEYDIVSDSAGSNHGTRYDATWESDCISGRCLSFDGLNDYVDIDSSDIILTSFSASAWAKLDQHDGWDVIIEKVGTDGKNDFMLGFIEDYFVMEFEDDDAWEGGGPNIQIDDASNYLGNWYHFTYTYDYDSKTIRSYVDGLPKTTTIVWDFSNSIGKIIIGADIDGSYPSVSSDQFDGNIDEVMIFSRALSEEEVKLLYEIK